eukprot:TRINITY_DN2714_c0_g4_i1.p1 TRINITY_DN2714_c0_g4~~TRINITY_DN2714_c0_g4_i1.p1  ORF type:complete len:141 (-),score=28.57 TRINITY_DN2714_c0_g4_i1:92-514(-)
MKRKASSSDGGRTADPEGQRRRKEGQGEASSSDARGAQPSESVGVQRAKQEEGSRDTVSNKSSFDEELGSAIISILRNRKPGTTMWPSEAARAVARSSSGWRCLMDATREVARHLAAQGIISILQKGEVLDSQGAWKGPI